MVALSLPSLDVSKPAKRVRRLELKLKYNVNYKFSALIMNFETQPLFIKGKTRTEGLHSIEKAAL